MQRSKMLPKDESRICGRTRYQLNSPGVCLCLLYMRSFDASAFSLSYMGIRFIITPVRYLIEGQRRQIANEKLPPRWIKLSKCICTLIWTFEWLHLTDLWGGKGRQKHRQKNRIERSDTYLNKDKFPDVSWNLTQSIIFTGEKQTNKQKTWWCADFPDWNLLRKEKCFLFQFWIKIWHFKTSTYIGRNSWMDS